MLDPDAVRDLEHLELLDLSCLQVGRLPESVGSHGRVGVVALQLGIDVEGFLVQACVGFRLRLLPRPGEDLSIQHFRFGVLRILRQDQPDVLQGAIGFGSHILLAIHRHPHRALQGSDRLRHRVVVARLQPGRAALTLEIPAHLLQDGTNRGEVLLLELLLSRDLDLAA